MAKLPVSRRAVTRALLVAPAAIGASSALAAPAASAAECNPAWDQAVNRFKGARHAYHSACTAFAQAEARLSVVLGKRPQEPQPAARAKIRTSMTPDEIREHYRQTAEEEAALAEYKRDFAAWQTRHMELRKTMTDPHDAEMSQASDDDLASFRAMFATPVDTLGALQQKIELVRDYVEPGIVLEEDETASLLDTLMQDVQRISRSV